MPETELSAIDLFAGAGGLAEGFRQAGFSTLAANDFDTAAATTFVSNFPEAAFLGGSISGISGRKLLRLAGLRKGELDVLLGGRRAKRSLSTTTSEGFTMSARACFGSTSGSSRSCAPKR